jgi:predicted MPP superfamily phosphohydrolase
MKLKTLAAILLGIAATLHATAQPAKPGLKFNDNGKFRIMQMTDLHYHYGQPERAASTLAFIREAVERVRPDLIMVTGDLVVSEDTRRAWQDVAGALNESQTPWAVVLGNHDSEYELTNRQIIDLLAEYTYSLTENGPEDVTGNGNYALPVLSSSPDGQPAAVLYCFDTRKQHNWLRYDQMNWYRQQSLRFATANGGRQLPSIAFYHVPVPEFNEVIGQPTTVGLQQEEVCCPRQNSGSFTAMQENGDIMGIFIGHDHNNNYIGCLHNVCLAYGYKSGRQSYGEIGRGVRVIELHEGERKFTTWLLQLYECENKEGTWTPVTDVKPRYTVTYPDSFVEK